MTLDIRPRSATRRAARAALASAAATILPALAAAAEPDFEPATAVPSAHARIGIERIRFPGDDARVGLVGTSYLVDVPGESGISIGPAVYGAVSGRHGGFFTIGGEAAWRQRVVGPFRVELGLYAGGGGGGGAPQGSGLMLRPHADLLWDVGGAALGVSVSRVRFSGGRIDSTQWGLVLNVNDQFRYLRAASLGVPVRAGGRAGIGFDRVQFVGGVYRTRGSRTLLDGSAQPRDVGTLGVRAEQAWGPNTYWGIETNGAVRGTVAGYVEYLGTLGAETEVVQDRVTLGGRVGVGMGGGGGISTGGGLLAKAAVYGVVRLTNELGVALEGGIATAPNGSFRATSASAALVWALDGPRALGTPARPVRTDFSTGAARHDAPRRGGGTRAVALTMLKVDRYVTPNVYVTGQAHGAFAGGASGYASALVGVGWMQPLGARWYAAGEVLGGAAGGGGVDSRGGVGQAMAHVGFQVTPAFSLRGSVGRVEALRGPLGSNVVGVSANFTYGVSAGS